MECFGSAFSFTISIKTRNKKPKFFYLITKWVLNSDLVIRLITHTKANKIKSTIFLLPSIKLQGEQKQIEKIHERIRISSKANVNWLYDRKSLLCFKVKFCIDIYLYCIGKKRMRMNISLCMTRLTTINDETNFKYTY